VKGTILRFSSIVTFGRWGTR